MDAAARLFAAQGYRATTIRDISGAVGMLPGSVYYHFPSKEDLLLAVYEAAVEGIAARVDRTIDSTRALGDPWRTLEAVCTAHMEAVLDRSDYAQVMVGVLPDDAPKIRDALIRLRDGYEDRIKAVVDRLDLASAKEKRTVRLMLLGAMNAARTWYQPGGESPATLAREFVGALRQPEKTRGS